MIATRGVSLSLAARSTPVRCLRPTVAPRRPALRMASGGDKQLDQVSQVGASSACGCCSHGPGFRRSIGAFV
eukprot:1143049-Pelagomonas_calceolata.AAC.4